jgi:hypothetical protein
VKPDEMLDMDEVDKATVVRGYELRTHDMQWMIRWLGSIVYVAPGNKPMAPEKLLKLKCDRKNTGTTKAAEVKKKIDEADDIFARMDAIPADKWKTEIIK